MFEEILSIKPYFFSLREIDDNVSLDLKFPITWIIEPIIKSVQGLAFKQQDKSDSTVLISLITKSTADGYDRVFSTCRDIIKLNLEEEQKRQLLAEKMAELKLLFQNKSLDELKTINLIKDESYKQGINLSGEGDSNEPDTTGKEQGKINQRNKKG